MVRAVRETRPRVNMDPLNASPFLTSDISDTYGSEFQTRYLAWRNVDCAQPHPSLFSVSPSAEHPCWPHFIGRPVILENQTTVTDAFRQPQHDLFGASHATDHDPPSTPAGLDCWLRSPSNSGDRYHQHTPSTVNETYTRATSSQSMRRNLPRLVTDRPPTDTWRTGEPGINCQYRSNPSNLLPPYSYQGRSPSPSGSDEYQSSTSDSSWVNVSDEDYMDIDWRESVPRQSSKLDLRQRSGEVPNHGEMEGSSRHEGGFPVSRIPIDYVGNVVTSGITSAGLSHPQESTRWSLQAPRNTETGASQGGSRRRRVSSAQRSKDAAPTFNGTACLRCQIKHIHCGYGKICPGCEHDVNGQAMYKQRHLCYRVHLTEALVYRKTAVSFPDGVPKFDGKSFVPKSSIRITLYNAGFAQWPQPPEQRPNLKVTLREFRDIPGIPVTTRWMDGSTRTGIDLPRYAIHNKERKQVIKNLETAIGSTRGTLLFELQCGRDEIISCVLAEAAKHFGRCGALDDALNLAIVTRLISKSFNVASGPDALRLAPSGNPTLNSSCPFHGRIPISKVLDGQLDSILMDFMKHWQKHGLSTLKDMMMSHSRENWYNIFLTTFVLLSNLEFLYQNQNEQKRRYGTTTGRVEAMMQEWKHAAENLTTHYHAVSHGAMPLDEEWVLEAQETANMSEEDLDFLARLKGLVEARGEEIRRLGAGQPGHPLVWTSALFFPE